MKKIIFIPILYMLILFNVFAQTEGEDKITISANYFLSSVNFSIKEIASGSILTWRDIYLQGGYLSVEFPQNSGVFDKSSISASFSTSFHGYWTDDDANNTANVISVSTTEAFLLELKYETIANKSIFNPKLGFDFNMLSFKNYGGRFFSGRIINNYTNIEGLACGYDIYKIGIFGGIQAALNTKFFYLEACGHIGIGIYLNIANWLNNPTFKSPVSFLNFGHSFRGGSDLEIGLKLDEITFFLKALFVFDINPGLGVSLQNQSDDTMPVQLHYSNLSRASFSAGLKISF
jgi:hypothetical protein